MKKFEKKKIVKSLIINCKNQKRQQNYKRKNNME